MNFTRMAVLLSLCALITSGCSRYHSESTKRDQAECQQMGFEPGTDRYMDCVVKLHAGRHVPAIARR